MKRKNKKHQSMKSSGVSSKNFSKKGKKLTALSFFTGAMGLDLGLERAGISVVLASEIDKATRETILANRPEVTLIGDIRNYSAESIKEVIPASKKIDLVFGGPPCQAFSTAGKRQAFDDERGNVFLKFIDLILELEPRYAVIENVRGLLSVPLVHRPHSMRGTGYPTLTNEEQQGGALYFILRKLRNAGYGLSFNLYNSANFGSPQVRERVVILCSRDGSVLPFLSPTHSENGEFGLKPWVTLRQVLAGLPPAPCDHPHFPEKRLRFYRMLKEGQNWRDLPKHLQQEAMGNSYFAGGGKTGFLRRLAWDKPSPTLVTHPAMPATDLAHPEEDRPLSIQEYKRIQEFPDDWVICGSLTDQYRQVGNAVPPSLGLAIGRALIAHDEGEQLPNFAGFTYSRYIRTDHKSWERDYLARYAAMACQSALDFA